MAMIITEALRAEHVVFHNLFDHIERTLPKLRTLAEVHALAALMHDLLVAHAKVEDELILEPLEHCIAQLGQQETFHQEHEEIDQSLKDTLTSTHVRNARKLLQTAVLASRTHFDKEERLIFPMAEKLLKTQTLGILGESWRERREAITA